VYIEVSADQKPCLGFIANGTLCSSCHNFDDQLLTVASFPGAAQLFIACSTSFVQMKMMCGLGMSLSWQFLVHKCGAI